MIKTGNEEYLAKRDGSDYVNAFFNRYVIARVYVTISIFLSVLISLYDPISIQAKSIIYTGGNDFMLYAAIFICSLSVFDIIINDILPDKYIFKHAYENRHVIYMGLALISFSLSLGIIFTFGGVFQLGRLWLDGFVAAIVAVLDIFARHKGTSWRYGKH